MRRTSPILSATLDCLSAVAPKTRFFDKQLSTLQFLIAHGRLPEMRPLLNDALFRIKTSDEILRPERVFTSDKELAKEFIRQRIDERHVVPSLAVLRSKQEIRDFTFPQRCVIKPTHTSGDVVLRHGGERVDMAKILGWMDKNYYRSWREVNYRYLAPKIIVEPFVFDADTADDMKIFCFRGKARVIHWDFDRGSAISRMLYTRDWQPLDASLKYPVATKQKARPANLDAMIEAAECLASPFDLVRIDMYTNDVDFHVGEITHVAGNATNPFLPPSAEERVSALLFVEDPPGTQT
ncbi:ATP-grasp fold amidoligase family protein [Stappia stellulata]|uniref:ATP-grasp fold amidoligase family protein n=1 Tax=Stappia stellulata TaxID=71235 RepID=UPI000404AAA7|nr:ATP-grasp fold amidoligase family protein [Stappia stellulata]